MKNKNFPITFGAQDLNFEYISFRNLTNNFCCGLERLLDFFEHFSDEQKSKTLKEIENTQENICAIFRLLNHKVNVKQTKKD
ncbi:MAG: hypothetical protein EBS06_03425 [Proteobacteria bacterium]|nr:hypothetical protein [Pseudomonadota bacterium]